MCVALHALLSHSVSLYDLVSFVRLPFSCCYANNICSLDGVYVLTL